MQTPPLDILYLVTKGSWGGAQRYVYDLAKALHESGSSVAVAYGTSGLLAEKLEMAGIEGIPLSSITRDISLIREVRAFFALTRLLRVRRPRVLHLNSSKAGFLGALAGRMCGVPRIIFTAHGWAFNEDRPFYERLIFRLIHGITILLSHKTICVSQAIYDDMRFFPFAKNRMVVVHNGIEAPQFKNRAEARNFLYPETAGFWIGMITELHPTKRVEDAITAVAEVSNRYPGVVLVVMGEGEQRTKLSSLITELNQESRIKLAGFVEDSASYLSAFDLFLLPSRSEALGYVLLEAGHAGLPVIASRVGGIPEVVTDTVSGILVTPEKPEELASHIEALIAEPELAVRLGKALKTNVSSAFSLKRMITETKALY